MLYSMTKVTMSGLVSLMLSGMMSLVLTAPVAQNSIDDIKQALKTQIKDQEQALESLTKLTAAAPNTKGLEVSNIKSMSYSNINGAENKVQQEEEKVSDPVSSKLISDITEKLEQNQATPDDTPKSSLHASIDIPEQGIHKVIDTDDESQITEEAAEKKDTIEFTPDVVAGYLRREGKIEQFQELLNQLVENAQITPEEAEQYEKSVMDAFYSKDTGNDVNIEMPNMEESLYPQAFANEDPQPVFPLYNAAPYQDKVDMYPMGFDQGPIVPGNQIQEDRMIEDFSPISLDEMISYLLNEWLTRAIVTGDPEASEILSNIVDYVSRDNDPNDEEQVKAILGDIIAETLLEDLMPRLAPEPVQDMGIFREAAQQRVPFPFPVPQQQEKQQNDEDTKGESQEESKEETSENTQQNEQSSEQTDELENQLKM